MNQSLLDIYDLYNENLLLAQYDVSEIFDHKLTKGELREDFLIDVINKQFKNIEIGKGIVTNGAAQSGQTDIIICKNSARRRCFTNSSNTIIVEPKDCLMIMEVKSNATGLDIKNFNDKVARIVDLDPDNKPLCGMFCYRIDLKKETVLKRFGYNYDKDLDSYVKNETFSIEGCTYSNIDFIISLHKSQNYDEIIEDKQFFIYKDTNYGYQLIQQYPIMKNLFSLLSRIDDI